MTTTSLHALVTGKPSRQLILKYRLIISTPTGSTAYNLAAGGSIVQSNVPSISLTPLAPHSLSFRPLILPENCTIKVRKAADNRTPAWVSLDGATRFEIKDGEALIVQSSEYRIAFLTDPHDNLTELWAKRLTKLLKWNVRPMLKPLKKRDERAEKYGMQLAPSGSQI